MFCYAGDDQQATDDDHIGVSVTGQRGVGGGRAGAGRQSEE